MRLDVFLNAFFDRSGFYYKTTSEIIGILHFSIYTYWSKKPIFQELFPKYCKVFLGSHEGCQIIYHLECDGLSKSHSAASFVVSKSLIVFAPSLVDDSCSYSFFVNFPMVSPLKDGVT